MDMTHDEMKTVMVPMSDYVGIVAREAARIALAEHAKSCEVRKIAEKASEEIGKLKLTWSKVTGICIGAGLVGGAGYGIAGKILSVIGKTL